MKTPDRKLLDRRPRGGRRGSATQLRGFTVLEMLMVIAIIGILAAVSIPAMRGLTESNEVEAAVRQLRADLELARQKAIGERTTVAMVFIPPSILQPAMLAGRDADDVAEMRQLQGGAYTQYAIYALRKAGDQPGKPVPRYLTEWRSLPAKTFVAEAKFGPPGPFAFDYGSFRFPTADKTNAVLLPYVAFNYEGRLVSLSSTNFATDIQIPLARGAILYGRDTNSGAVLNFTVQEIPPNNSRSMSNHIVIDWLTGRARHERQEIR